MATAQPQGRTYRRDEVIAFRKTREAWGGLSNMAAGYPLRIAEVKIGTSEALYQACRFPHLPQVQELIIGETSPMTAKMRSKPYRSQSRSDWEQVRIPVMKWCLRVKLAQNWEKFGGLLLETGERPIVEDSSKDDFWGAIRDETGAFQGRNVLGRLLMELREILKTDPDSLAQVPPLAIPHFTLFGRDIPRVIAPRTSVINRSVSDPNLEQLAAAEMATTPDVIVGEAGAETVPVQPTLMFPEKARGRGGKVSEERAPPTPEFEMPSSASTEPAFISMPPLRAVALIAAAVAAGVALWILVR